MSHTSPLAPKPVSRVLVLHARQGGVTPEHVRHFEERQERSLQQANVPQGATKSTTRLMQRVFGVSAVLSIALGLSACHRETSPTPAKTEPASASTANRAQLGGTSSAQPSNSDTSVNATASGGRHDSGTLPALGANSSFVRKATGRVVAIGDLHGDLKASIAAFRLAGVIDPSDKWIGNDTTVVQTGDVLDRGEHERSLLDWLDKIEAQASKSGGQLLRLNGNHEVMNVAGDFRYVAPSGFADFADVTGTLPPELGAIKESERGRFLAFLPGGPWARKLSRYPVVMVVGDTVFAHGGLRPMHVDYGIARMNAEVASWMRGEAGLPKALQSDDSPYWVRDYGDAVTGDACLLLDQTLSRLGAARLVVGHTPQKDGITFACDGKVARIDVGLSAHYGSHAAAVLEIRNGKMRVIDNGSPKPSAE